MKLYSECLPPLPHIAAKEPQHKQILKVVLRLLVPSLACKKLGSPLPSQQVKSYTNWKINNSS